MYPSSINRGYRSGVAAALNRGIQPLVSILYQSRLSFWQDGFEPVYHFSTGIHPLSIEAIVLATDFRSTRRLICCIHPLSIEAIVLAWRVIAAISPNFCIHPLSIEAIVLASVLLDKCVAGV